MPQPDTFTRAADQMSHDSAQMIARVIFLNFARLDRIIQTQRLVYVKWLLAFSLIGALRKHKPAEGFVELFCKNAGKSSVK